ncbi:MAG TPA: MBL fold metallo-hydrolase [Candidatus Aquilonibacter sp.]|jgi:phosphoribosyl 1,2-cyclic phosphodiesterase|nr:MBL fold metallo-hydrolase [Candidatus Aquilonibacter sp.]
MCVTVSMLASGSRGNCAWIASSRTRILVDAGISCREIFKRLRSLGEDPQSLSAILITHEHSDHVYGLATLAKKLRIPVFMTGATHAVWARAQRNENGERPQIERLERFQSGHRFQIGDIEVKPFTIPHDAIDPVGFTFRVEGTKVSVATDLGYLPANVRDHLRGSDILIVESNHDVEMLRGGSYPWSVKQRVASNVGHLSNVKLADFLAGDYDNNAAFVVLAHLSEQNNHPEIARREAERALALRGGLFNNRVRVAVQSKVLEPIRL